MLSLRLLGLLRPFAAQAALSVLLGFMTVASAIGLMALSAYLIQKAALEPPILELTTAIVGVRFFGIARALFRYAERYVSHDTTLRVLRDLRVDLVAGLEPCAPAVFAGSPRADVLARLVGDVDLLEAFFLKILSPAFVAVASVLAATIVIAAFLPAAALVFAAIALAAGIAAPWWAARRMREDGATLAPARARLVEDTVELVGGMHDLCASARVRDQVVRIEADDARLSRLARLHARHAGIAEAGVALATGSAVWAMLTISGAAAASGTLSALLIGVIVMTAMASFEALAPLGDAFAGWHATRNAARRVFATVDAPASVSEPDEPCVIPDRGPPDLRLIDVSVTYPDSRCPALAHANLNVAPGARVGIVGPSGSGKTTTAHLLTRLVDPSDGVVTLAGRTIAGFASRDVRRVVGLAEQDAHIFDTTIRGNLALARPNADDAELFDALRAVGLDDWVSELPGGIDTEVGENGLQMSRGQRRRLALARLLLGSHLVWIFDEPTDGIDPGSARELVTGLIARAEKRSVIILTHDETLLDLVDEVVRMAYVSGLSPLAATDATTDHLP